MFIACFRSGFRTEMALLSAAARAGSDVNSVRLPEFDPIDAPGCYDLLPPGIRL